MKISGTNSIPFPVAQVWDALLDPAVLVRTIPGCERLETKGENTYAMTVTAGVAAIKGTYDGTCALSDLVEHQSLVMRLQGAGAPGTDRRHRAGRVRATPTAGPGSPTRPTRSSAAWSAASASGCSAASRSGWPRSSSTTSRAPSVGPAPDRGRGRGVGHRVGPSTERPRAAEPRGAVSNDFLTGIAVGAGLVLLGVVAGRWSRHR